jgi:hypothetical protein
VAVGQYATSTGTDAFIDTLVGGTWKSMEAPVPSDAVAESSAGTFLKSVDCTSAGSCVALGSYLNGTGSGHTVGFIDTLAAGSWSAQTAPQPAGAAAKQDVFPVSVSCPSMGPCAAAGVYVNASSNLQAELLTQSAGGTWAAQDAPLPANAGAGAGEDSLLFSLSCATDVCVAGGTYADTSGKNRGLLERLSGGAWSGTETPEPANAGSGSDQSASIAAVSCTFDGCVAVGNYMDSTAGHRALVNTIDGAGKVTATEGPQPADAAT